MYSLCRYSQSLDQWTTWCVTWMWTNTTKRQDENFYFIILLLLSVLTINLWYKWTTALHRYCLMLIRKWRSRWSDHIHNSCLSLPAQSNDVGGGCHMEKEGLKRSLDLLQRHSVKFDCIVTKRWPWVQKFLKDQKITHYYDVQHTAKGYLELITLWMYSYVEVVPSCF